MEIIIHRVNKIKDFEVKKIVKFTKSILSTSIKLGGSSIKDFSSSNGKKGSFQQYFKVYGKKNELCPNKNCKNKIIRFTISSRSTFFCSLCELCHQSNAGRQKSEGL